MNYNGGISVSIPLTNIFNSFDNQKKFALSVTKANLESDDEKKKLLIMEKSILNKYSKIKKDIPILEKEVALRKQEQKIKTFHEAELKRKKIEYQQWMVKDKKESVLSYLNSQDELYDSTIKLNKYERDLKYYKLYLDFIN